MTMKVLHVITDTDRRGAQVFGTALAGRLDELGLENRVVALVDRPTGGLAVEALGTRPRGVATLRALRAAMREVDITVAHGSATLAACGLAGMGARRPFVYRQISDPAYWTRTTSRRLRTKALYRFPEHVVSLSERTKVVLAQRFSIEPDRITVIPNAVDERTFTEADAIDRQRARSHLGLPEERAVIGFVGALSEEKGVFDLLDAMTDGQVLVMAGDGPAGGQLRERAAARSIDLRVLGPVSDPQLVYAASDVLVLPSWSEQQPGVLLEAALVGTPVVATRVGLVDELVLDGETGCLTASQAPREIAAAIDEVLARPDRARARALAARRHTLAHFTMEQVASSWGQLLRSLIG